MPSIVLKISCAPGPHSRLSAAIEENYMSRLRVRIELNRGGVGVPLDKLASVVQQSQSFFRMLGDDVHIDQSQGDWLGFDFDHESLNFTAEFVGPVTQEQVAAFHAAFDGTTPLRRATI